GLSKHLVTTYEDIIRLIELGDSVRTVGATLMNATSSRSHSVFTITMTQTKINKASGSQSHMVSKINLVDLAGSERCPSEEGISINKSLSALGNVIEALVKKANGSK
ncbi:kinesin-like protein, partial [Kipferlia bialata]